MMVNITKKVNLSEFEAWSGGYDTLKELTYEEIEIVSDFICEIQEIDEANNELWSETRLNDFLWFERELIEEIIGRKLFE